MLVAPAVGSFLAVLIRRLPSGEPVGFARSRCESCGKLLSTAELVPIASYLHQRGHCRGCGARIAPAHLWIELAAIAVACWAAVIDSGPRLWADCAFGWTLLALAWIDAEHFVLPDLLTLPLLLAGLSWALVAEPDALTDHALGAVIAYLLLRTIAAAYRRLRNRDGLGAGDAKLLAAAAAWTGWQGLGPIILIAAIAGLAFAAALRLRGFRIGPATALPFGPFLALGAWLVWLYGYPDFN